MSARGLGLFAGAVALLSVVAILAPRLTAALPQTRTLSLYNIHTKETLTVEFKRNGKFVPEAMERINWLLRDWRKNEKTTMDPELIDLLWEVHTELGSREPIHIISGYRSQGTNSMLRSTRGGQATQSRHILGMAADVHFPDVPVRRLRYAGLIREKGGVGYYPTSAIPFVHLDTGRVRAWPRLPRHELALLFPDGRTSHVPADGRPLTSSDVQIARAQNGDIAAQVAEVVNLRRAAHDPATRVALAKAPTPPVPAAPRTQVAAATPPPARASAWSASETRTPDAPTPKLVAQPAIAQRPARTPEGPSSEDRLKLAQLAAMASIPMPRRTPPAITPVSLSDTAEPAENLGGPAPKPAGDMIGRKLAALATDVLANAANSGAQQGRFGWASGWNSAAASVDDTSWAVAPAFDEEHPEELSYRPFPLAPDMTETASADDPALTHMEHPDVAKTLEMLDQADELPPMKLRPGQQVAQLLWALQFQGEAVPLAQVFDKKPQPAPSGLAERTVRLSSR